MEGGVTLTPGGLSDPDYPNDGRNISWGVNSVFNVSQPGRAGLAVVIVRDFDPTGQCNFRNDLAAEWPLNEGRGVVAYDMVNNTSPGAIVGQVAWVTSTLRNKNAMQFESYLGNSLPQVVIPSFPPNIVDSFTLSFWALPSAMHEIDQPLAANGSLTQSAAANDTAGFSGQKYAISAATVSMPQGM